MVCRRAAPQAPKPQDRGQTVWWARRDPDAVLQLSLGGLPVPPQGELLLTASRVPEHRTPDWGLTHRNVPADRPGSYKSRIKVLAGLVSFLPVFSFL